MPHRSRLGFFVIDCQGEDLDGAVASWSAALDLPFHRDEDPLFAVGETAADQPRILLQSVPHESRVRLDLETDDRVAEQSRLEALGATLVEHQAKGWTIMQAPTGHRSCPVGPQRLDFATSAPEYD